MVWSVNIFLAIIGIKVFGILGSSGWYGWNGESEGSTTVVLVLQWDICKGQEMEWKMVMVMLQKAYF